MMLTPIDSHVFRLGQGDAGESLDELVERGILLQIFEQCCDWHPRTAKNPGTARAVRIAFDIGAGRPVNHR